MRLSSLAPLTVFLILCIAFFLNSYALEVFNIFYVSEGGSPFFKIHIYSYVILIVVILKVLKFGLLGYIKPLGGFTKYWLLFVGCIVYVICFGFIKFGTSGMAYVVDTLLTPTLLLPIVLALTPKQRELLSRMILLLLLINSLTAIGEYVIGKRLFDYQFEEYQYYFRSTAFMNHPLSNALISVSLAILLYNDKRYNAMLIFTITCIAIFAFGARTATVIFIIASIPSLYVIYFLEKTGGQGIKRTDLIIMKVSILLGSFALMYAVTALNFGARIFENFMIDGSAQSRFDAFYVFDFLSDEELLFGVYQDFFEDLMLYIDNAIVENYIIGWLLNYGFVGALPLIISFFCFLFALFKNSTFLVRVAVIAFTVVSVSNNSLASKNPALLYFFITYAAVYQYGLNSAKKLPLDKYKRI